VVEPSLPQFFFAGEYRGKGVCVEALMCEGVSLSTKTSAQIQKMKQKMRRSSLPSVASVSEGVEPEQQAVTANNSRKPSITGGLSLPKDLDASAGDESERYKSVMKLLTQLRHPNIVLFMGAYIEEKRPVALPSPVRSATVAM
jgi:hypothetical protein